MRLTLLLLLLTISGISQTADDTLVVHQRIARMENFVRGSVSLSALEDSVAAFSLYRKVPGRANVAKLERTLELSLQQTRYFITFSLPGGALFYVLNLYAVRDTIIYAAMGPEHGTLKSLSTDSTLLDNLLRQRASTYGQRLPLLQLIADLQEYDIYAQGCGEMRSPPRLKSIQEELIEKKDTAALTQWLCSVNPEKQAYGLEGLWALAAKRVVLPFSTLLIMEHVARLDVQLYSCNGCVRYTQQAMRSVVAAGEIKNYRRKHYGKEKRPKS